MGRTRVSGREKKLAQRLRIFLLQQHGLISRRLVQSQHRHAP